MFRLLKLRKKLWLISWHQLMTDHKIKDWKYSLIVHKGVFVDGLNDGFKGDLGGQSVTVLNHWLPVWTVPTVHCNTKHSHKQGLKRTRSSLFTTIGQTDILPSTQRQPACRTHAYMSVLEWDSSWSPVR